MDWWIVSLVLGELVCLVIVIAIVAFYRLGRAKQKSEERLRLLERFQSADDLQRFLESERGAELLAAFGVGSAQRGGGPARALALLAFALGILAGAAGLGFLVLSGFEPWNDRDGFLVPGVLCTTVGAALVAVGWLVRRMSPTHDLAASHAALERERREVVEAARRVTP